jgi:hypothetical protein
MVLVAAPAGAAKVKLDKTAAKTVGIFLFFIFVSPAADDFMTLSLKGILE